MLDGMEELTLQESYFIPFKSCFKVAFMVYWATTYSEPCQTSKMELFAKIVAA